MTVYLDANCVIYLVEASPIWGPKITARLTPAEIVEEVYLLVYGRPPRAEERAIGLRVFERSANRREAVEDLLWALVNTPEFVFKD